MPRSNQCRDQINQRQIGLDQELEIVSRAFRLSIPEHIKELELLIEEIKDNVTETVDEAIFKAHQLRGSAGAYGLHDIGLAVGILEDQLTLLKRNDMAKESTIKTSIDSTIQLLHYLVKDDNSSIPDDRLDNYGSPARKNRQAIREQDNSNIVLLIDDDPDFVKLVRSVLQTESEAATVISVGRLDDALALLDEVEPDLVLLDLGLPDSSGLATFHRIKVKASSVPILILSASKDTNLADHAVENGAHDYLIKNQISPGALRRCVRYSMTRFRVEQSTRRLRAIEDFIATIAHDLKVPVQAMERITRHILNQKDLPEKMSETLRILHLSNQRVLSRLENLLELYKFEFGSVNPEYTKVDLVALLEESLSEKRKALESKEIKILLDLPEQAKVCVDPLLFKKVISEILDNAAKFADPKSTLAVNLRVELDCFKIEIASIGPTIPRGQLKDLFKNFWRGTPGISYVATTGMGLYYCHQVMKMLSGSVACTSLDKTTTVTIKIPNSIS